MSALKINRGLYTFKIGMNEVEGLKDVMSKLMAPVQVALKKEIYWSEVELTEAEYLGRDGFIPHSHNCGGFQIHQVIPKCEEYDFSFLEFGEVSDEDTKGMTEKEREDYESTMDGEGHLDAALEIWFKFEGIDKQTGKMKFYLVLSGGNHDAPYFRDTPVLFETEFQSATLKGVERSGAAAVKKLIKFMGL